MAETLLTRQHDGQTITAAVGSVIVVRLDESPTTGYGWAPLAADEALALVGSDFALPAQAGVGGGGQRTLRFEVRQRGKHLLQLVLVRPWEGEAGAVDRFSVTVQATPG
jgi:predicted secreted protein